MLQHDEAKVRFARGSRIKDEGSWRFASTTTMGGLFLKDITDSTLQLRQTRTFRGWCRPSCKARALPTQPMKNRLHVGSDKSDILSDIDEPFLLIAGRSFKAHGKHFDWRKHSFNPLHKINYDRATTFVEIINAVFPGGENTLTKQNSSIILLEALLDKPKKLSSLVPDTKDTQDAHNKVKRFLLSPYLKRFLTNRTNINFNETLVANLEDLPQFDRMVIGNILIANHKGQIVIPDWGFYACPFHLSLIEQGRLIAGVNYLDELPDKLRNAALLIPDKLPCRTTTEDAETLADYAGIPRGINERQDFIQKAIGA